MTYGAIGGCVVALILLVTAGIKMIDMRHEIMMMSSARVKAETLYEHSLRQIEVMKQNYERNCK